MATFEITFSAATNVPGPNTSTNLWGHPNGIISPAPDPAITSGFSGSVSDTLRLSGPLDTFTPPEGETVTDLQVYMTGGYNDTGPGTWHPVACVIPGKASISGVEATFPGTPAISGFPVEDFSEQLVAELSGTDLLSSIETGDVLNLYTNYPPSSFPWSFGFSHLRLVITTGPVDDGGDDGGSDVCTGRRAIPADLKAQLLLGCMRLAVCVKITRPDTTVLGFTDHDRPLTVDGVIYSPSAGLSVSALRQQIGLAVSNFEITGLQTTGVAASDFRKGFYDGARIEVFMVDWSDVSLGVITLQRGFVGDVTFTDAGFTIEARSVSQRLQQAIGRVYLPTCDAELGDTRCGVDLASFTFDRTITAVLDKRHVTLGSDTQPTGYYDGGKLTFTSGDNNGVVAEIKTHELASGEAAITLQEPLAYLPAVGDTISVQAGCLKRFTEDCKNKFANAERFRGFPTIPQSSTTNASAA